MYIPLKGFVALTLWPWIFVREDKSAKFTPMMKRHEATHAHQQIDCLAVGAIIAVVMLIAGYGWWSLISLGLFFELYILEFLIKLPFCHFDTNRAYMSISTEQEAYEHQDEIYYNDVRRHFAWLKYVFTIK
jgi:hypothetical protein